MNFCKFTNETRNGIEDATANSGQTYLAALNGTASGGGYELALACEHIMLVDDRSSAVSLPELPLLGVLPGTGGLTRVVDKRHVRRDLRRLLRHQGRGHRREARRSQWRLVDEAVPRPQWDETVAERAPPSWPRGPTRPATRPAIALTPLAKAAHRRPRSPTGYVTRDARPRRGTVEITVRGPEPTPPTVAAVHEQARTSGRSR